VLVAEETMALVINDCQVSAQALSGGLKSDVLHGGVNFSKGSITLFPTPQSCLDLLVNYDNRPRLHERLLKSRREDEEEEEGDDEEEEELRMLSAGYEDD
jgi:hypothetical protein